MQIKFGLEATALWRVAHHVFHRTVRLGAMIGYDGGAVASASEDRPASYRQKAGFEAVPRKSSGQLGPGR